MSVTIIHSHAEKCVFENIDHVPATFHNQSSTNAALLFEDNAAVIMKGRSPSWRHGTRTHKVDSDVVFF